MLLGLKEKMRHYIDYHLEVISYLEIDEGSNKTKNSGW